jgi:hypothetical protein
MIEEVKIKVTGTKPIWFGELKVYPGEEATVPFKQIDKSNRHIEIISTAKKAVKGRRKR